MFLCAIPAPGCRELACVGFVPATVLVCQNASWPCAWLYPVTAPFLQAVHYCSFAGVRSFLSTCPEPRMFCVCAVSFTFAVLQISGSCICFATLVLHLAVCVWCLNHLNITKGSNFWKQKYNWPPAENPLSSAFVLGWAWSVWHFSMYSSSLSLLGICTL